MTPVRTEAANLSRTSVAPRFAAVVAVLALCAGTALAQFGGANQMPSASTPPGQEPGQTNPVGTNAEPSQQGNVKPETGVNLGPHQMADKMFLRKAAQGSMAEVQLGELAEKNGGTPDVKKFGEVMASNHTQLSQALQPISKNMGLEPSTKLDKKDQSELKKLSGLSGTAFDTEYLAFIVKDHRADVKDFAEEANQTENNDLKSLVLKGESMIQAHLKMAEELASGQGTAASK